MSFGFSPSDLVSLLQALNNVFNVLKSEAVKGFGRYWTKYKHFCYVVQCLDDASKNQNSSPMLDDVRRDIHNSLQSFFRTIGGFKIYLDEHRDRGSFRGAIKKLKWSWRMGIVQNLCEELEGLVVFATFFLLADQRLHATVHVRDIPVPFPDPLPLFDDTFTFEDARRRVRSISFRDISSWENLHEFLMRVWSSKPGRSSISNMEYVIYNSTTGEEFLPSSPCVKPFQDVIKSGNRVKMSVIFPYEEWHTDRCPGCQTHRSERSRAHVKVTCKNCRLSLHFRDQFEDGPDPLTQIAIDDISQSGTARGLTEQFISEMDEIGVSNSGLTKNERKSLISQSLPNLQTDNQIDSGDKIARIADFRRVTLCRVRWPRRGAEPAVSKADRRLSKAMDLVARYLQITEEPILPHRWLTTKLTMPVSQGEAFAKQLLAYYEQRCREQPSFKYLYELMAVYDQCAQETGVTFHPSIVKIRCLLWGYSRVLNTEARVILRLSNILNRIFAQPEDTAENPPGIAERFPGVNLFLRGLALRVGGDILSKLENPDYFSATMCRIVKDSRSLCLELISEKSLQNYDMDLSPECFFDKTMFTRNSVLEKWKNDYRHALCQNLETLMIQDRIMPKTLMNMLSSKPLRSSPQLSQEHSGLSF